MILFAMHSGGVTEMDTPKLEELARGRDAMQPFFAKAILQLSDMLERGELKGRTPDDLFVGLKQ